MFDIELTTKIPALEEGESLVYGRIQIGDFVEDFVANLAEWSPAHYELQWREAAERLANGETKSAFVVSFTPEDCVVWWPCYRIGETVFIQNHFLFYKRHPSFSIEHMYEHVKDRETLSDDGVTPISEWELPLDWIRDFIKRRPGS